MRNPSSGPARLGVVARLASGALVSPAPAFADQVHDALSAYALYQNDVSALLDNDIANGRTVDAALARISRHNPQMSAAAGSPMAR